MPRRAVTLLVVLACSLQAQSKDAARPSVRLPDEAAGIDAIARMLIASFDQVDVIGLGEAHFRKVDSHLRLALIRHPDFAKRVRTVVIECGSNCRKEFLGRSLTTCRGGCRSVFKGSKLTLGQMADVGIYVGANPK